VHQLTDGGAHVSVDALGIAETCLNSVSSLRKLGRHLQLGHTTRAEQGKVALPIDDILLKELRLFGAFGMQGQRYGTMLDMVKAGRLEPGRVVSRTVNLDEITAVASASSQQEPSQVDTTMTSPGRSASIAAISPA